LVCVPDVTTPPKPPTGPGTNDIDGDGNLNKDDSDSDGDGNPNGSDPDADNDGIPNATDSTPFGSGSEGVKLSSGDFDNDGIPNGSDPDIDGDGIPNGSDPTPGGPGTRPVIDPTGDNDGDGKPDGGGDFDKDGIPNGSDPDIDGDGIPNGSDPDKDGDGIPNGSDPTPGGPGTRPDGGGGDCVGDNCGEGGGGDGASLGDLDLYTSKEKTFADVWNKFTSQVQNAPIALAGDRFFQVSSISGACEVYSADVPFLNTQVTFDVQCSSEVAEGLRIAGLIVLILAAWVAFKIALL
jgi:hypothetical protein